MQSTVAYRSRQPASDADLKWVRILNAHFENALNYGELELYYAQCNDLHNLKIAYFQVIMNWDRGKDNMNKNKNFN